ncbi:MAG: cytochrome P450 [Solirubrobacteraceae bacterium]
MSLPPGPRAPGVVQSYRWALQPTQLMERCAEQFGDTFTVRLAPGRRDLVFLSHPQDIKTLFTTDPEIAPSGTANSPIAPLLGPNSVLTLTGPRHLRQRKLLLGPFHGDRMQAYGAVIAETTRAELAGWPRGAVLELHLAMQRITLDVILRAVFGVADARMDPLRRALETLLRSGARGVLLQFARFVVGLGLSPRLRRQIERVDGLIHEEIRLRRAEHERGGQDILSLLIGARDEHGGALSDAELRDELVTLLVAGHETTATALAWGFERLIRTPDVLRRLRGELDRGEEGYLDAVTSETLRLRPVVPNVVRQLRAPVAIRGHELPAGVRAVPCIYLTHRRADLYEDPLVFRPERFLAEAPQTYSWIPFGGGIRRCIGASFATFEIKTVMRVVLAECELSLPAGERDSEAARRRSVTLAPANGARALVRARG